MNTKDKGNKAEIAVAYRLIKLGWNVSFPFGDNSRYDIIAEKKGRMLRIQVKHSKSTSRRLIIKCYSSTDGKKNISYDKSQIDILAAFDARTSKIYFIPVEELPSSFICLRFKKPSNNQKQGIRYAKKYRKLG